MKDYQSDADAEGVKKKKKKPQIEKTGDDSTEIEESQSPRKKKKKRHKHEETSEDNMPLEVILVTEEEGENETSQIERRKKKKHHREKTKDDDGEIENSMVERKKKKKIVEQKNDSENETSEMARKREKHKIEETRESGGTQEIVRSRSAAEEPPKHQHPCPYCEATFTSKIALGMHQKRAHGAVVAAKFQLVKVRRWTDKEICLLAGQQALVDSGRVKLKKKGINDFLIEQFDWLDPGRKNSLKKLRQGERWNAVLREELAAIMAQAHDKEEAFSIEPAPQMNALGNLGIGSALPSVVEKKTKKKLYLHADKFYQSFNPNGEMGEEKKKKKKKVAVEENIQTACIQENQDNSFEHKQTEKESGDFRSDQPRGATSSTAPANDYQPSHVEPHGNGSKEKEQNSRISCWACPKTFKQKDKFKRHLMRRHFIDKPFSCRLCKKYFKEVGLKAQTDQGSKVAQDICSSCVLENDKRSPNEKKTKSRGDNVCEEQMSTPENQRVRNNAPEQNDLTYSCEQCLKTFSSKSHVIKHIKTVHYGQESYRPGDKDDPKEKCSYCDKAFVLKGRLAEHVKKHENDVLLSCEICRKCFSDKGSLRKHIIGHDKDKALQDKSSTTNKKGKEEGNVTCTISGQKFSDKKTLHKHLSHHYSNKLFTCNICKKTFADEDALYKHTFVHSEIPGGDAHGRPVKDCTKQYKQMLLDTVTSDEDDHVPPVKTSNPSVPESPYKCRTCRNSDGECQKLPSLDLASDDEQVPISCSVCKKSYPSKLELKRHLKKNGTFHCEECGAAFHSVEELAEHLQSHLQMLPIKQKKNLSLPYTCEVCAQVFNTASSIQTHILTHKVSKPYNCDTCGRGFTQHKSLQNHLTVHMDNCPYKCSVCGKNFSQQSYLTRHSKVHAPKVSSSEENAPRGTAKKPVVKENELICEFCDETFKDQKIFESHVKKHLTDKPFGCNTCNKSYAKAVSLENHVLTHMKFSKSKVNKKVSQMFLKDCGHPCQICCLQVSGRSVSESCRICKSQCPELNSSKVQDSHDDAWEDNPCNVCRLKLHLKKHGMFFCEECQTNFHSIEDLAGHLLGHLPSSAAEPDQAWD